MWFVNPVVDNNHIYFCEGDHAVILKINIENHETTMIDRIPDEKFYGHMRYNVSSKFKDDILVVPQFGNRVYLYDESDKTWETICDVEPYKEGKPKYISSARISNYAVLIPWCSRTVLIYNFLTKEIKSIDGWFSEVCDEIDERGIFSGNYCIFKNEVYIPFCEYPYILVLNAAENCYRLIKLENTELNTKTGNRGLAISDDAMFLASTHAGDICKYDLKGHFIEKINNFPNGFLVKEKAFTDIVCKNGSLWIFPNESNMILKYNLSNREIENVNIEGLTQKNGEIQKKDMFTVYDPFSVDKDTIGFIVPGEEYVFFVNTKTEESYRFMMDNGIGKKDIKNIIRENEILTEDGFTSLDIFLKGVTSL